MINKTRKMALQEKRRSLKRKTENFLKIFLIIFVGGYLLFFSSKIWLPNTNSDIKATKIGTTVEANDRAVTLTKWIYSKTQNKMEIVVEIKNLSIDGMNAYEWSLVDKEKGSLKLYPVIEKEDLVVLHGETKWRWNEVSLRMKSKRNNDNFNTVKFYTNKKNVDTQKMITKKMANEYRKEGINSKIKFFEAEIKKLNLKIKKERQIIENGSAAIKNLRDNESYETEKERTETETKIAGINSTIASSQSKIDGFALEIAELNKKSEKKKELLNDL